MSKIPGLLLFQPMPHVAGVSELAEPWKSASTEVKLLYALTVAGFGNLEQLQQTNNEIAINNGNLLANHAVGDYNGPVKRYWLNGGPSNTYGFALPAALPNLTQYYKPARDARENYPSLAGIVMETPIWSLPSDAVLFIVEP